MASISRIATSHIECKPKCKPTINPLHFTLLYLKALTVNTSVSGSINCKRVYTGFILLYEY